MEKIIKDKYILKQVISETEYVTSYLAVENDTEKKLTAKKYHTEHIPNEYIFAIIDKLDLARYVSIEGLEKIYDYQYSDSVLWVVCEYKKLKPLSSLMSQGDVLSVDQSVDLLKKVLNVLKSLKKYNFFHGAITEHNIGYDKEGRVYLSDHIVDGYLKLFFSSLGAVPDAHYCSPEFLERGIVSYSSDIYSLGVIFYRLTTGSYPFPATQKVKKVNRYHAKGFVFPKEIFSVIPSYVDHLIIRMISPDLSFRIRDINKIITCLDNKTVLGIPKHTDEQKESRTKQSYLKYALFLIVPMVLGALIAYIYSMYLGFFNAIPEVMVPDLIGIDRDRAIVTLRDVGLKPEVAGYRVHSVITSNAVIETIPEKGRIVKADRVIKLFLSKGKDMVDVPGLVGMTYSDAVDQVYTAGLIPTIDRKIFSRTFPKNKVIMQVPSENMPVTQDSLVKLVVSEGYPVQVHAVLNDANPSSNIVMTRVKFAIPEDWDDNRVRVEIVSSDNHVETIYEEMHRVGEIMLLEFEENKMSRIRVFFNEETAFDSKIKDYIVELDDE